METKGLRNCKKGSVLDLIYVPLIIFVAAITLVVSYMIIVQCNATGLFDTDPNAQQAYGWANTTILNMDNMMTFLIVGLTLAVIIMGYFAYNHPVFFFIGVFMLTIAIFLGAIISNTYDVFATQDQVSPYSGMFPKLNFLISQLPIYLTIVGFVLLIVMYIGYKRQI